MHIDKRTSSLYKESILLPFCTPLQEKAAMSPFLKLSSAFLLFSLLFPHGEAAGCSLSNILVTQAKTGNVVEGKPEYEVTVTNRCKCAQSKVVARCFGLSSVRPVDPRAIRPTDDTNCVVNGGRPMPGGLAIKFRYAWMTPQDFPLVSSLIKC